VLETFVFDELDRQASWQDEPVSMLHFSESQRAEVDLVIELANGSLLGIEVKLADHVTSGGLNGLRRLRDLVGDRFKGGIVLAAVPAAYTPPDDPDIVVAPLSALWAYVA
jgi:hypothetical protein